MSTINDGGPAFPLADSCCEYGNTNRSNANGMTLRDYFAAKAMQGAMANPVMAEEEGLDIEDNAAYYYRVADAMLRAREVKS